MRNGGFFICSVAALSLSPFAPTQTHIVRTAVIMFVGVAIAGLLFQAWTGLAADPQYYRGLPTSASLM